MKYNVKPDNELSPELYRIARAKGTEPPFSGEYTLEKRLGTYACAVCGAPLFDSATKYDSGSGWPSFTAPAAPDAVSEHHDSSHGMVRTEVTCAHCAAHLGHVFPDGPRDAGGLRYCINSRSLELKEKS
jgi:peptide-methionine (R)-S-oxide reductase